MRKNQEEIQTALAIQKTKKRRKSENIEAESPKGIGKTCIQNRGNQPAIEEPRALEKKPQASTRVIVREQVQARQEKRLK